MLFDRTHPCHPIRNFDFVISIDVIRMKSYVDGFFNPTCVTVRIMINKTQPGPKQEQFLLQRRVLKSRSILRASKLYISSMLFNSLSTCFSYEFFATFTGDFVKNALLLHAKFQSSRLSSSKTVEASRSIHD